jgi:ubiquinone/menaquinone biosynthesis C-methylase UbiE
VAATGDSKSLSQERYERFADGYVTSQTHATGQDLVRLVEIAQPEPVWAVLDVATGGGHTALRFAPHVARVTATDITPRMLEKARAFVRDSGVENVTFELADAETLPFEGATYDLVTCRIAPHHFPDAARFVSESVRVLVPGGLLLVQDHLLPEEETAARSVDGFERLRDPSHNRAFSESEWVGMFRAGGLQVEHTEQIVKRHQFMDWAKRQGCTLGTITGLERMMADAPAAVLEWLQPRDFGTAAASFANRHIIISGRKNQRGQQG